MATFKELVHREKHMIIHGQSAQFRIIKYILFFALAVWLVRWKGGQATILVFLALAIISLAIHFLFRWKTKAWSESWGLYKKIPFDKK